MERLSDSLRRSRIWTSTLDAELRNRVRVVCGEISKPNLGMHSDVLNSLANRVQAVIHNAAMVNYVSDYDELRPHNVEGTRELLRFACSGIRKDFHFISSTVIFGWTVKEELVETDKNDAMSHLEFGYAQSKWVAEQLVFAAEKQGLSVRVYRPAFISSSSDGAASAQDITIRLFAFMINHGTAVNAENQISFLPADVVADNITAIFKRPQTNGNTFHVTADNYYNIKDITELITRDYGYRFVYYDIPKFVAEMQRVCTRADPLYPLVDFFKRSERHITAIQHKRYNNDYYRQAREQSGRDPSEPALAQIVSYLMTYMLREGFISGNRRRSNLHKSEAKKSRTELVHARSMPG
jgi:thioester reductase-like protein